MYYVLYIMYYALCIIYYASAGLAKQPRRSDAGHVSSHDVRLATLRSLYKVALHATKAAACSANLAWLRSVFFWVSIPGI